MSIASTGLSDHERGAPRVTRLAAASRIEEFAVNNRISRALAYKEIAAGRLIATKVAGRTIILPEHEQAWRDALPKVQPSATTAA